MQGLKLTLHPGIAMAVGKGAESEQGNVKIGFRGSGGVFCVSGVNFRCLTLNWRRVYNWFSSHFPNHQNPLTFPFLPHRASNRLISRKSIT